jgi:hypothetical protein
MYFVELLLHGITLASHPDNVLIEKKFKVDVESLLCEGRVITDMDRALVLTPAKLKTWACYHEKK